MKLYHINVQIYNDHGDLLDTRLSFKSLDELRNVDVNRLVDKAEDYGRENAMLYEELFDSKEDMEIAMDNGLTSDDLTNFN